MEQYKEQFIEFMVDCNVLKFGDFVTKSGRKTPFFVNTGFYRTGGQLKRLGEYYAKAINEKFGLDFDVLFGPAYKGIPLTVAATMAISDLYDKDIRYCSNRKEVKDHGDTGILLGSPMQDGDKVVIGNRWDFYYTYFIREFNLKDNDESFNDFIRALIEDFDSEIQHYPKYKNMFFYY